MAKIVTTENLRWDGPNEKLWVYNGLDCCITHQVFGTLGQIKAERKGAADPAYDFERAMFGPAITCMARGLRFDEAEAAYVLEDMKVPYKALQDLLNEISLIVWERPVNHRSPLQLKQFFYEALNIEPIHKYVKGVVKVDTGREAMEKIRDQYPRGCMPAKIVIDLKEMDKKRELLEAKRDWDGRYRTSYGWTETWRFKSSESNFWSGGNIQNWTEELRSAAIPDDGYTFFYCDLEQAESRAVAYLSGDEEYIKACESSDLHTYVAMLVWPHLPWTGDPKEDRKIAERPYYRHFDHRFMCKKAGHGSNYGLTAPSLARKLMIKQRDAFRFQYLYYGGEAKSVDLERWHSQDTTAGFNLLIDTGEREGTFIYIKGAFPNIRKWHTEVANELQTTGQLVNPFGFTRTFWGRVWADETVREGLAFNPQSTVGILAKIGLWRTWHELEPEGVQILGDVHDAIMGQIPTARLDELAPRVIQCMTNPLQIGGRTMTIPAELLVGDCWRKFNNDPNKGKIFLRGLKKWKPTTTKN